MGNDFKGDVIVQFSGGSDSTLAAALLAERYNRVHLLTYDRVSFIGARNHTQEAAGRLKAVYGNKKIKHRVLKIDRVHEYLCYHDYWKLLKNFKSAVAAMTFSKLAMHLCSGAFAIKYGIPAVADGAAHYMHMYPDQNKTIALQPLKAFYQKLSIDHLSPVFDYPYSTDSALYDKGISKYAGVRGTNRDRQVYYMEQVLFAFFYKYYSSTHGFTKYEQTLRSLYENRLELMSLILNQWQNGEKTCLDNVDL